MTTMLKSLSALIIALFITIPAYAGITSEPKSGTSASAITCSNVLPVKHPGLAMKIDGVVVEYDYVSPKDTGADRFVTIDTGAIAVPSRYWRIRDFGSATPHDGPIDASGFRYVTGRLGVCDILEGSNNTSDWTNVHFLESGLANRINLDGSATITTTPRDRYEFHRRSDGSVYYTPQQDLLLPVIVDEPPFGAEIEIKSDEERIHDLEQSMRTQRRITGLMIDTMDKLSKAIDSISVMLADLASPTSTAHAKRGRK